MTNIGLLFPFYDGCYDEVELREVDGCGRPECSSPIHAFHCFWMTTLPRKQMLSNILCARQHLTVLLEEAR
jgi:hypothetical protein